MLREDQALSTYPWRRYPAHLQDQRPLWLRVDRVLGEFGIPGDTRAGRRRFEQVLPGKAGVKVELARRLRRETTMSLKWIAQQLGIGSWKYLSNLLGQRAADPAQPDLGI